MGGLSGGTVISITGSDFYAGVLVDVGGSSCSSVSVANSASITCITPNHAAGAVNVKVTNLDSQFVNSSTGFTYRVAPAPTSIITTPGSIAGGVVATIGGTGFDTYYGSSVKIGGVDCTLPVVTSSTSLQCTLPNHSVGNAAVVVTNNIDNQSGTLAGGFTFYDAPTITNISPTSGKATAGTVVTITGVGFRASATVDFGGSACTVSALSSTSITCITIAHAAGVVAVKVINTDAQYFIATNAFTYRAAPVLTSISPTAGAILGGTVLTITGTGFYAGPTVTVGGETCTNVSVVSATKITCTTPPTISGAGTATVLVTNADLQNHNLPNAFTYRAAPTISGISLNSGSLNGGANVTITGKGFVSDVIVTIGGSTSICTLPTINPDGTTITCTTPSRSLVGAVDVVVKNSDNQSVTLTNGYTYLRSPTVSSVSLSYGPVSGGSEVTLTGDYFVTGASVYFDGVLCTSSSVVNAKSITCKTPAHIAGAVAVRFTNPDTQTGISSTNIFTYVAAPTISSVLLNNGTSAGGPFAGGSIIRITGTGFYLGAVVLIGSDVCTTTSLSSTLITCRTPSYSSGALIATVTVTNPDNQTVSSAGGFTYRLPPTLSNVSLSAGPTAGGTEVTITGTGFISSPQVYFDGSPCTSVLFVSATSITCKTPPHSVGAVSVVVTNSDNQTTTLATGYIYLPAPTVTSVSLAYGPVGGGSSVTVRGTNFLSGATVDFGGSACGSVSVVSSTILTCTTSGHALGAVTVKVTNTDNQFGTAPTAYTYIAGPVVTSVAPIGGPLAGGTAITITGSGYFSGASVTIDGIACSNVSIVSATTITCTTPAGSAGARTVEVTNADSQAGSKAGVFTYQAGPTITNFNPISGFASGTTAVAITGTGFLLGATVKIGGSDCTVTNRTSIKINCTTTSHADGVAAVTVSNLDTQSVTAATTFTYRAAPTITSVSPSGGKLAQGTVITVTGTGFYGTPSVLVGGEACGAEAFVSSTVMTCAAPAKTAAGAVAIKVTNEDGQNVTSGATAYTYRGAPGVKNVSLDKGSEAGGTNVKITGSGFVAGAEVDFDGADCIVTSLADASINCTTTAHAPGAVTINVTNTDLQSDPTPLAGAFTYIAAPTITSITPSSGPIAGGSSVILTGTGFLAGDTVYIGGIQSTCSPIISSTSITCTSPAHAVGTVDVSVMDAYSQVATATSAYTYRTAPVLSIVSPTSGSLSGGTAITITGSGFYTGAIVTVGGASCTGLTVVNATTITCTTSSHASGSVSLIVKNADNQTNAANTAYVYKSLPALLVWQVGLASPTPPSSDSYGSTSTNISHTYTLKNTGDLTSSAITTSITGNSPGAWTRGADNCNTLSLAANTSCTVVLNFLGEYLGSGNYSAVLNATATTGGTTTNIISGSKP